MEEKRLSDYVFAVIIIDAVCVAVILLGILAVKFISPQKFKKIQTFFRSEICRDTDLTEISSYFKDEN